MRVKDFISFNSESFFNGAVQAEWFYDALKAVAVANSYVFHGSNYYGVTSQDVEAGSHKLIDTASYVACIAERLYLKKGNPYLMTIAGYGTGKSHLAVTLAALFSGHNAKLQKGVLNNISAVDVTAGQKTEKYIAKGNNLVIVLNGMNNFNMDYEVLRCVRESLKLHGVDESFLKQATKAFETAKHFVERTYELKRQEYDNVFHQKKIKCDDKNKKEYILTHLESDQEIFSIVNSIYKEFNGSEVKWEHGLAAGDILNLLNEELCIKQGRFNGILILFDEFGRYIEYAATNPTVAGDSALQQIFEAVQSANGNIVFIGFIQSELSAYLARIDQTSTIIRYVGRYQSGEKWYLYSNFETVLASLIRKTDQNLFEKRIGLFVEKQGHYFTKLFDRIYRWGKSFSANKGVWSDKTMFDRVIAKGCYPLHPITVFMLSALSAWMQQRSTFSFTESMLNDIANMELKDNWNLYIYPVQIIDSGIYSEMINAEEKGLVNSQHTLLYQSIISKLDDRLTDDEKTILKAVLLINVCRFNFHDRADMLSAIAFCSGFSEDEINPLFQSLEENYGIIAYNESSNKVDMLAEASGQNDFKRLYNRKLFALGKFNCLDHCDEEIMTLVGLDAPVDTTFARSNSISSVEWKWDKRLIPIDNITNSYITACISEVARINSGEANRGLQIYTYCTEDQIEQISVASRCCETCQMWNYAIDILILTDAGNEFYKSIRTRTILKQFRKEEQEKFPKFYSPALRKAENEIINAFHKMSKERVFLNKYGMAKIDDRIEKYCTLRFEEIYSSAPPFSFDGFEKKLTAAIKNHYVTICSRLLDGSLTNEMSYKSLPVDTRNRITSSIQVGPASSWQIYSKNFELVEPVNDRIKAVYLEALNEIESNGTLSIWNCFGKYLKAPYGMNEYSLCLFVCYLLALKRTRLELTYDKKPIKPAEIVPILFDKGKIKFTEIYRISLSLNAADRSEDIIALYTKITNNTLVEQVEILQNDLQMIENKHELNNELSGKVAIAKMRLKDGEKLYQQLYSKIGQWSKKISESNDYSACATATQALISLTEQSGEIEEGSAYFYSDSYNEKIRELRIIATQTLDKFFDGPVNAIKCKITNWDEFRKKYTQLANEVERCGRFNDATIIRRRIEEVHTLIEEEFKYQGQEAECERELLSCNDCMSFAYDECVRHLTTLNQWSEFWKDTTRKDIRAKINGALRNIADRKLQLDTQFKALQAEINQVTSYNDLSHLVYKIKRISSLNPPEVIDFYMNRTLTEIDELGTVINEFKLETPEEIKTARMSLSKLASNPWRILQENRIEEAETLLRDKNNQWIEKYVKIDATVLSAQECIQWNERTTPLPEYLSDETLVMYKSKVLQVQGQLKNCKIQGVVLMFDQLDIEEQRQCFDSLKKRLYE